MVEGHFLAELIPILHWQGVEIGVKNRSKDPASNQTFEPQTSRSVVEGLNHSATTPLDSSYLIFNKREMVQWRGDRKTSKHGSFILQSVTPGSMFIVRMKKRPWYQWRNLVHSQKSEAGVLRIAFRYASLNRLGCDWVSGGWGQNYLCPKKMYRSHELSLSEKNVFTPDRLQVVFSSILSCCRLGYSKNVICVVFVWTKQRCSRLTDCKKCSLVLCVAVDQSISNNV